MLTRSISFYLKMVEAKLYKKCKIACIHGMLAEKYWSQAERCKSKNRRERLLHKAKRYYRLGEQYWE